MVTKRSVPWGDEGPGKVFMQNFQRRWYHRIRIRKSELLRTACVKKLTKEVVRDFLSTLKSIYDKYDLHEHPEKIFNADETGLTTDATSSSCFYKKGTRSAIVLNPTLGKTMHTVLVCGSASGELLPPFVVYKGKHLYDSWSKGGPKGTQYTTTSSGWMEEEAFCCWLKRVCKCMP
jgi:hypothetical protein